VEDDLRQYTVAAAAVETASGSLHPAEGASGSAVVLRYRGALVGHHLLQDGMEEVLDFARAPGVAGIAALAAWERADAAFAYDIGEARLLGAALSDTPQPLAAMQLIAASAGCLEEAATNAEASGLYCHGALSPWRLAVRPDGGVCIVGYGVAPVEVLAWLDEEIDDDPGDGLVYSPPERVEDKGEDLRSDLYALGMVAARVALGRPPLRGDPADIVDAILAGRPRKEIEGADLPVAAAELIGRLLTPKLRRRPRSGRDVARLAAEAAADLAGPGLAALVFPQAGDPASLSGDDGSDEATVVIDAADVARALASGEAGAEATPQAAEPLDDLEASIDDDEGLAPMPLDPLFLDEGADDERTMTHLPAGRSPAGEEVSGLMRKPLAAPPRTPSPRPLPELPEPVPDLGPDPTLDAVKQHGRLIVERADALAASAAEIAQTLEARAGEVDNGERLLAVARHHAERSRKAATSASSAAGLLELDEDAPGALITLDLVRNGEQQCQQSAQEALDQLAELERTVERQRQLAQSLADAARRAQDDADRATDAANQADDLVTSLEDDLRSGALGADGVTEAIDEAVAAAERAHAAAEAAREHAEAAEVASRVDEATDAAEAATRAAEQATSGVEATVEAADRARRLEAEGRQATIGRARDHGESARAAAAQAEQALARADEALELARTDESATLRDRCAAGVKTIQGAAERAEAAVRSAQSAATSRAATRAADTAQQADDEARQALEQVRASSDRIVQLAGEVAERRAAVSKAHAEARELTERSERQATKARQEIDTLFEDTRGVSGERAVTLRAEALEFVQSAERGVRKIAQELEVVLALDDLQAMEQHLTGLRDQAERVASSAGRAHERGAEARDQAERELAEIRRREAAAAAAAEAAGEARADADRSQEAVQEAWKRAREVEAYLATAPHDDAEALRKKALEIIDIAEFQAGEAASSASMAEQETDPAEARAHAQTARSFAERIALDLPEALHALDEAEAVARKEVTDRERALSHTTEVHSSVQALGKGLGRVLDEARTDATKWSEVEAVATSLQQLEALAEALDEDLTEASWARDRARQVATADEALSMIPVADKALQRAKDKDRRAEALREALSKAVQAAVTEASAREESRRTVEESAQTVAAALDTVRTARDRLAQSIEAHDASGAGAHDAALSIRAALERLVQADESVSELQRIVSEAQAAEVAVRAADTARGLAQQAERDREQATEDETRGVAAAEQEAEARAEAHRRRLEAAQQDAHHQVERATQTVQRVDEVLDDAEAAAQQTDNEPAQAAFREALRSGDALRGDVARVEALSSEAAAATDAEQAEALASQAGDVADRLADAAAKVQQLVQDAHDLARAAAEEAEALEQVKAEVVSTTERANEEVARAKSEAKRILGILREAPPTQVRSVAEAASQHVQSATNAAAKVRAAAPLAAAADDLAVAQNILRTSRLALQRAKAAADAVQRLVGDAMERMRREKEALAEKLAEARVQAAAPAQEAEAERRKAEGWLEAGGKVAEEHPGSGEVQRHWALLQAKVQGLQEAAEQAQEVAASAREAATFEAVEQVQQQVRTAADRALATAEAARQALKTLRTTAAALQERLAQLELTRQETQDHAHAAEQAAEQAELTARALARDLDTHEAHQEVLGRFVDAARDASERTASAAEQARAAATAAATVPDPDDVEDLADDAHSALQKALDGLERVAVCEVAYQEKRDKLVAQAAREAAEAEAEARRAEQEAARRAEADREAEDKERRAREAQRRERFRRRREERANTTAALDADTLRSRLQSKRPPDLAADEEVTAEDVPAPRPRARRRGSENQTNASLRNVRSWSPKKDAAPSPQAPGQRPSRPSRPRRAARPRPERPDNPNETKADALLERLRRRRED